MKVVKRIFKSINQFFSSHIGWYLAKANKNLNHSDKKEISAYHSAILSLLTNHKKVKIAIIGANDGYHNDPIYKINKSFPNRTEVLLIEPQSVLIPYLKENYLFHPSSIIYNGAVGPKGKLDLYSINPDYWEHLETPPYAKDWPKYRAPSGITSSDQTQILEYLKRFLNKNKNIEKAISKITVECKSLLTIVNETGFDKNIDIIQIDAEGFDDEVIYHSNIELLQPRIIFFEKGNLSRNRYNAVEKYLSSLGYIIFHVENDALALKIYDLV